jgi:hypothetical protein
LLFEDVDLICRRHCNRGGPVRGQECVDLICWCADSNAFCDRSGARALAREPGMARMGWSVSAVTLAGPTPSLVTSGILDRKIAVINHSDPMAAASNLQALPGNQLRAWKKLEIDMALFSSDSRLRSLLNERRSPSDVAFIVGATIALIGLAIVSVVLGVAPAVDPAIFVAP